MTSKEITELRKSGRLAEAFQAAETEFANNANKYTASPLFWCLYDQLKQSSPQEAPAIVERMQFLYHTYDEGNDIMQKSLQKAENQLLPHSTEVKNACAQAREGRNAIELCRNITRLFDAGEISSELYSDYGWLIYYALKNTPLTDAENRKKLLAKYLQLNLPKPSLLHSRILSEAVNVEKNTPLLFRIRDFIKLWGLENLTDDDWTPYTTQDGNVLPTLVERLIDVYAKEIEHDKVVAPEEFSALIDTALKKFPNNQNLPRNKAFVLISQGKKDEAITYYRNLILAYPSKYYQWAELAELVDDVDTKIGLLCKSLTFGNDESFLGTIRLALAEHLLSIGRPANAKCELDSYRETYQSKGWGLKSEYWQLENRVGSITPIADNSELYREFIPKAEEFIYSALPTQFAVKISHTQEEDRNRPGRKITIWSLRTKNSNLRLKKPAKFALDKRTPNGTPFEVKLKDNKIVWIKPSNKTDMPDWIKKASGEVHIRTDKNGNPYAIIDGVYIGSRLLQNIQEGQSVNFTALQKTDGRWQAISLSKPMR